jgi:transcriptional regulator with XRE-family HTH domain
MSNSTERLQVWMVARSLTKSELARQLGVSLALVSLVLSGKRRPSDRVMWRFAQVYGHEAARVVFDNGTDVVPRANDLSDCDSPESSGGSTQGGAASIPPATTDPAQASCG